MEKLSERTVSIDLREALLLADNTLIDLGYSLSLSDVEEFVSDMYEVFLSQALHSRTCGTCDMVTARNIFVCTIGSPNNKFASCVARTGTAVKLQQKREADKVITELQKVFNRMIRALHVVKINDYVMCGRSLKINCLVHKQ